MPVNDERPRNAPIVIGPNEKSLGGLSRTLGRHLVPRFVASLVYYLRDRAVVSTSSIVQFSSLVKLGKGTVVKPFAVIQTSGGRVVFGRNCAVSSFNHIAAGQADVVIGDHVRFGPHVTVVGTTRRYRRKDQLIIEQGFADRGIRIGNDVLIGARAVLLDGCDIGDGAVIGAGSIVTGQVPQYAVVFGTAAKVVSSRTE
jgi:acetyltransferase-like isoleucine patch superfamily enzyme